jgi:hypothetical protein
LGWFSRDEADATWRIKMLTNAKDEPQGITTIQSPVHGRNLRKGFQQDPKG